MIFDSLTPEQARLIKDVANWKKELRTKRAAVETGLILTDLVQLKAWKLFRTIVLDLAAKQQEEYNKIERLHLPENQERAIRLQERVIFLKEFVCEIVEGQTDQQLLARLSDDAKKAQSELDTRNIPY
jgi:hypothetical protein